MNFLDGILGGDEALKKIMESAWRDPASALAKGLGLAEARRIVDASDRFELWGEGACWLVLSGALDILWSSPEGRIFIGRVEAGGLAFSMSAENEAIHAIAIPSEETEIVQTAWNDVAAWAAKDEKTDASNLVKAWLRTVSAAMPAESTEPAADPDTDLEPLLDSANRKVMEDAAKRFNTARQTRHKRNEASQFRLDARLDDELSETAEMVDRHFRSLEFGELSFHDAVRQVLDAVGFAHVPSMVQPKPNESEMDLIERFARRNDLQVRAINLQHNWWRQDHGVLLGYVRDSRDPVALVPVPGGYEIASARDRPRVTAKLAATLDPLAYAFFIPSPEGAQSPWRLFRFGLLGEGRDVRNIIFCLILGAIFSIVPPISIGWLMGSIIPSADVGQIRVFTALLLVTAAAAAMTGIVQSLASLRLEGKMEYRIQTAVWVHILSLRAQFFRQYNAGDLSNRADSVDAMRTTLGQAVSFLLTSSVGVIFSMILMIYYDWRVALVVLVVSLLFAAVAILYGRVILSFNQRVLDQVGQLQGLVLQIIGSIPKLRVAGADRRLFAKWLQGYRKMVNLSLHQSILNYRLRVIRAAFPYLVILAVLGTIGFQLDIIFDFFESRPRPVDDWGKVMPTARFVAFNVALGQFTASLYLATRGVLYLFLLKPHFNRVLPILKAPREENAGYDELGDIRGRVEARNVSFRYSAKSSLVLTDLSFVAEQGEMTAIVGPSGAGKSTIFRLLLGFEQPESGSIMVDGNDVRFVNQWSLRQRIGVVMQDGRLLSGSVYENVTTGRPYSVEEVTTALEAAGLAEEVASWPMGLNTMIGDGAVMMSKGQQQRLMIARAIIRKPKILLLDEATSALDNITQDTVTRNLDKMNCTRLVIAHRLSTIKSADKILVIEQGSVVEHGKYDDLIKADGPFARLVAHQLQ